jgi:hypothetical protein
VLAQTLGHIPTEALLSSHPIDSAGVGVSTVAVRYIQEAEWVLVAPGAKPSIAAELRIDGSAHPVLVTGSPAGGDWRVGPPWRTRWPYLGHQRLSNVRIDPA